MDRSGGESIMTETVIVGLLSLAGTLCGAYFANKKSAALIAYRLEQLEQKVNKHNNLVERMYNMEGRADVFDEKISGVQNRLEDLERMGVR